VIAVLLSAARVASRRLNVAQRAWRYPHVGPRRGNGKPADAAELTFVPDRYPVAVEVDEPTALSAPTDAGLLVGRIAKPG
jgi:hypothetical protein